MFVCLVFFYKFEDRGHNSLTVSSEEIRASSSFKSEIPEAIISSKTLPKYAIEMCQIMKTGQIVVLCDLSDTRLTVPARRPSPSFNKWLDIQCMFVLNNAEGINKDILNHI